MLLKPIEAEVVHVEYVYPVWIVSVKILNHYDRFGHPEFEDRVFKMTRNIFVIPVERGEENPVLVSFDKLTEAELAMTEEADKNVSVGDHLRVLISGTYNPLIIGWTTDQLWQAAKSVLEAEESKSLLPSTL